MPTVCPTESFARTLSDIEIINFIETHLREHSHTFLNMNTINETYRDILLENGEHPEQLSKNYKKHLKSIIKENIPNIVFTKSAQKNKPQQLMSNVRDHKSPGL